MTTTTALEARYRRAIRWYPRHWRQANGDALVGTLLDVADAEARDTPARGELADLRRQGLATWIDRVVPGPIRTLAASLGTGSAAGFALVYLLFVSWAPFVPRPIEFDPPMFGPFLNGGVLVVIPMLLMAVSAVVRQRVLAACLGALALVGVVGAAAVHHWITAWDGPSKVTLGCAVLLVLVANLGTVRRPVAALIAFLVVGGGLAAVCLVLESQSFGRTHEIGDLVFWYAVAAPWLLAGAALGVTAIVAVLITRRLAPIAAAIALAWLPWGATGTVTFVVYAHEQTDAVILAGGSIALVALALAASRLPARPRARRDGVSGI